MQYNRRLHGLLQQKLRQLARKPLRSGEVAIPEVFNTFRVGFRYALYIMRVIDEESMASLTDKQIDLLVKQIEEDIGETPPTPN